MNMPQHGPNASVLPARPLDMKSTGHMGKIMGAMGKVSTLLTSSKITEKPMLLQIKDMKNG